MSKIQFKVKQVIELKFGSLTLGDFEKVSDWEGFAKYVRLDGAYVIMTGVTFVDQLFADLLREESFRDLQGVIAMSESIQTEIEAYRTGTKR